MAFRLGSLLALSAFLIITSSLLADSIDDAEAKKRGVPVQQIQLDRVTAQNADLQAKLTAVTTENAALKKQVEQLSAKVAELSKQLALVTPSNDLAKDGVPEVTATALEVMGEKYADKIVKLTGLSFSEAFLAPVDNLPTTIAKNGSLSGVLIEFAATDSNDKEFRRFFARKEVYGDLLANLKDGQKINVKGSVFALNGLGRYGFLCVKIEIVPTAVSAEHK